MLAPVRLPPRWQRLATRPVATATPRESSKLSLALERPKIGYNDARTIAEHFAALDPSHYTNKSTRSARAGKVFFIDYLRNGRGKTAIGPYSLLLALDFRWRDLEHGIRSDAFSMHNPPGFCAIGGRAVRPAFSCEPLTAATELCGLPFCAFADLRRLVLRAAAGFLRGSSRSTASLA